MHVEDRLPTAHTGIEHQTEITISVLSGELARKLDHLLEQRWIALSELVVLLQRPLRL